MTHSRATCYKPVGKRLSYGSGVRDAEKYKVCRYEREAGGGHGPTSSKERCGGRQREGCNGQGIRLRGTHRQSLANPAWHGHEDREERFQRAIRC